MDDRDVAEVADALLAAYTDGKPIAPPTAAHPEMTVDDAYAIQLRQIDARLAAAAVVKGHKVGLTSAAMQRQLGVNEPDYGHLLSDMFHAEHTVIPVGGFLQPRIEPEIAFVLRRPLRGPGLTVAEVLAAVDFVLPALELIDSRIADWKISLRDTIADNASSGGVILGSRPTPVDRVDLRLAGCLLHRNGELVGTGAGGAVLGSPVTALLWLANTLGARGVGLAAGHVVLPGSMTAAIPVHPGDRVTATIAGLGTVTARFSQEGTA